MATYEGTSEDFKKFIDGYTRNLVQNLTRKHKKKRQCTDCKNRTRLQAAHLKGHERPKIVQRILSNLNTSSNKDTITIDLNEFEKMFIAEHTPYDKVIKILCFDCHKKYDAKNDTEEIVPLIDEDVENDTDIITEDEILEPLEEVKIGKLAQKFFSEKISDFSDETIKKLLDPEFSKQHFDIYFSVLKEFQNDKDALDEKGKLRYYSPKSLVLERKVNEEVVGKYLLSNHWFKIQLPLLKKWMENN